MSVDVRETLYEYVGCVNTTKYCCYAYSLLKESEEDIRLY